MYFGMSDGYVGGLKNFVEKIFAVFRNPNTKLKTGFIYFCTFLNLHWKGKQMLFPILLFSDRTIWMSFIHKNAHYIYLMILFF